MEYKRSEIAAGVFLLASLALVAVMIFAVSDMQSLFKNKKDVMVLFQFSDGIEKNAQVRYSGIKIGKVANVRMAPESNDKVELTLSVYSDAVIKEDTKASIKTLGLVGGKYVELTGGTQQARPLAPGAALTGEESFKMEDLTKAGLEVVERIKNITNNVDRLVGDPATVKAVRTIALNLQAASADIRELTANVVVMTSGREEIAQGMKNVPVILNKLPEILKKLDDTAAVLKETTDKANAVVGDNRKKIDDTLDNVKELTKNLKELTEDVKGSPWKLIRKP
jgi:phospholipid/cholesterol/gamma-HCH transport system substrate-binding protein